MTAHATEPRAKFSHLVDALYQGHEGFLELRALPSTKREFLRPDDLQPARQFVTTRARENLYFGVALRKNDRNGTADNCLALPALFVDLDYKDSTEEDTRQRLDAFPLPPTIVVASGGGLQPYWCLKEPLGLTDPADKEFTRSLLRRLAIHLKADVKAAEVARVLRVAGTRNFKYSPPRPVLIEVYKPDRLYNPGEFDALLDVESLSGVSTTAPVMTAGVIPEGRRNDTLYRLARSLRAQGLDAETVTAAVQAVNSQSTATPLPPRELQALLRQSTTQRHRSDFLGHVPDAEPAAPVLTRLSDVATETIDWVWPGRLARGKKTLIAGDPGQGKSTFFYDTAARISRGGEWPDGGRAPLGNVLFLIAEDGLGDTVRPKIERAGGDPTRIYVLEAVHDRDGRRLVNLARDLAAIEAAVEQVRPELVVIDPITAYLGKTDSYKDSEVRALLAPLLAMIDKQRCALGTVAHLSKDQQRAALHRPGGSIAFVAAARLAFAVAADPNDAERRILAPLKANICTLAPSLAFRLPDGRVEWEAGTVTLDAEALLRPAPTGGGDPAERVDAEAFLRELLADGAKDSVEILKAAEANGISRATLFRVKPKIGVRAFRTGGVGASGKWAWALTVSPEHLSGLSPHGETLSTLSDIRPLSVSNGTKSINSLALVQEDADDDRNRY